jgi:pimeloyl-ACP methyl ester carboxylesterase
MKFVRYYIVLCTFLFAICGSAAAQSFTNAESRKINTMILDVIDRYEDFAGVYDEDSEYEFLRLFQSPDSPVYAGDLLLGYGVDETIPVSEYATKMLDFTPNVAVTISKVRKGHAYYENDMLYIPVSLQKSIEYTDGNLILSSDIFYDDKFDLTLLMACDLENEKCRIASITGSIDSEEAFPMNFVVIRRPEPTSSTLKLEDMLTVDGKKLHSWVVFPPNYDPNKKYPALLFCQGGPQSPVSQFWSYRWNFMTMASQGYIVVAPNRRGLPGFGMEWLEEISTNYGGHCMDDYKSAIDAAVKHYPSIDKNRLGCVGASFGGFSVYWLAGNHDKRFKCFIAHDGIFNLEQQYLETEEMWFANWDLGGAPWHQDDPAIKRTYDNSPHKFVDKWDAPILCIQGEKDYRIVTSQAMAAYNAALYRGIPAEFLVFSDENHWVLKPQNGMLWQRTFFNWLDRWLK